mgnify:CR=1 FL=1
MHRGVDFRPQSRSSQLRPLRCVIVIHSVVDLQNNKIEDVSVLDILESMPNLKVVYLKGNPVVEKIKNYRKTIISRCKKLTYLDDRPVFDDERALSEAWYDASPSLPLFHCGSCALSQL